MKKGRITIPTNKTFAYETKYFIDFWGANAVRDCDGTELPDNPQSLAKNVYKTYFVARWDNDFSYSHDQYNQNIALITDKKTATSNVLEIDLLEDVFEQQITPNLTSYKKYWQVFDRTTGLITSDWDYLKNNIVRINNAVPMHQYSVNFFARSLWDPTQIYNYVCNNWNITKDRDIDPIYPEAFDKLLINLRNWLKENKDVTTVRLTSLFYHFFLLYKNGKQNKIFDWSNYAMTASPKMFELFKEEYGYEISLEDIVNGGDYYNSYSIPSKKYLDYMDLVERIVAKKASIVVDEIHKAGKKAVMFWGDNWIGAEPYGKYFSTIGLDGLIGSVASGVNMRIVAEIPNLKFKEARLNPYFFPDTLADENAAIDRLNKSWLLERRALFRKPIDQIGFGGYLEIASKFKKFCLEVKTLCDEFRDIVHYIENSKPYSFLTVGILSYWGKRKSWSMFNISQDAAFLINNPYIGILEAMVGLPINIEFIDFEDIKANRLENIDVILNYGNAGNAYSGDCFWKDEKVVSNIRSFVFSGGGFIGIGEPSAYKYQGKFFQLSDILGVEEELGNTALYCRFNNKVNNNHFILEDVEKPIEYGGALNNIFALNGATILDAHFDENLPSYADNCNVKMAINDFGKGRSFYMTGMIFNHENTRLLYRALLWVSHKEKDIQKAFSNNYKTECHYYEKQNLYAVVNNTNEKQKTRFFDINGKSEVIDLSAREIKWIKRG